MTILSSSSRMRSRDTMDRRSCIASTAASRCGSGLRLKRAAKRAARNMRSGSSPNEISGSSGVRNRPAARSPRPSKGSINSMSGRRRARALMVKSRRDRSSSMSSPKVTSGLRESGTYTSARWVVISNCCPARRAPMVPKRPPGSTRRRPSPAPAARSRRAGRRSSGRSRGWSPPRRGKGRRAPNRPPGTGSARPGRNVPPAQRWRPAAAGTVRERRGIAPDHATAPRSLSLCRCDG